LANVMRAIISLRLAQRALYTGAGAKLLDARDPRLADR
jgi:hypothetical protein